MHHSKVINSISFADEFIDTLDNDDEKKTNVIDTVETDDHFNDNANTVNMQVDNEIVDGMVVDSWWSQDLLLPYKKDKLWSKFKYYCKTFIVINPRLFSLYLLYKSVGPRLFVILDMYTDSLVTLQLFDTVLNPSVDVPRREGLLLLILSILFLSFPFIMVWTTSLRFIQKYVNSDTFDKNTKQFFNILLVLYLFPIFGCAIVTIYEILWVFWDIYLGLSSFIQGKILVIDKDSQISSMKQFRKVIEIVGESLPQTILQLYLAFTSNNFGVNSSDLAFSLTVSLMNLLYNLYTLKQEAKYQGMSIASYTLSVLQLAEIPIAKLIPRLEGIRKGNVEFVNFSQFKIDKESLGPMIEVCSFCCGRF